VNLPNLITLGRLLAVPLAVWLILDSRMMEAFILFILAGISDAVDGFIAKNYDQRTQIGALLDPIADKALLVSMYVTLGVSYHLPTWLVILVVFRDVMIIGGFILLKLFDLPVRWQPLIISKINTGLQIALIALTLARLALGFGADELATGLIWATAATTVLSGTAYLFRTGRVLAGMEPSS
jgi:cardiolipin synthase